MCVCQTAGVNQRADCAAAIDMEMERKERAVCACVGVGGGKVELKTTYF